MFNILSRTYNFKLFQQVIIKYLCSSILEILNILKFIKFFFVDFFLNQKSKN